MQSMEDSVLLRQFVGNRSDEAFAELVTRHINLVYSVAMRRVGNQHQAEEITQAVFIILAKKAGGLRHDKALSSWLFQTTCLTATNFVRSEMRRHRREQEAQMQSDVNEPDDEVWRQIAPLLDSAVASLNEQDRRAIVLRFYEGRNLREVGLALGANEEAAKKRVARAVEKLQTYFLKRGVDSTADAITGAMAANSVQAAPVALAKTVAAVAVAKAATTSISTLTLVKGALKIMAWTKTKTALVAGAVVLLAAVTTTMVVYKNSPSGRLHANIARAKRGVPTNPAAIAQAEANSKILIFRDIPSWNRHPDFEDDLTSLHYQYTVKPSTEMATADLSSYDVIIIPGAQWNTPFYGNYIRNAARFDSYVSNGGTLVLELNGAEGSGITLPGGARMIQHGALDNYLTVPEHPILLPLGGRPIHANFASHGYLTGVPKGAMIMAVEFNRQKPVMSRPTFVEYSIGSGRVIAACQCFHDRDGSGRGPLMLTLVNYAAVKQWFTVR